MSPGWTGTVWATSCPLSRVPFLVWSGWSRQFPRSSRRSAAWLRETVGTSSATSAQRPRPRVFSQWSRSKRAPPSVVSQPHSSRPVFSRTSEATQRYRIRTAKTIPATRRAPQATGSTTSSAATIALPGSAAETAALTRSPSCWSRTWIRVRSSCIVSPPFSAKGRRYLGPLYHASPKNTRQRPPLSPLRRGCRRPPTEARQSKRRGPVRPLPSCLLAQSFSDGG